MSNPKLLVARLRKCAYDKKWPEGLLIESAARIESLEFALREICAWTERWATPDHPIATTANRALDGDQ